MIDFLCHRVKERRLVISDDADGRGIIYLRRTQLIYFLTCLSEPYLSAPTVGGGCLRVKPDPRRDEGTRWIASPISFVVFIRLVRIATPIARFCDWKVTRIKKPLIIEVRSFEF